MTTTRNRILDAVRDAAQDGDIENLTPAEIARRAGVHRVTFYKFWPDAQTAEIEAFAEEIDHLVTADALLGNDAHSVTELAAVYDGILEKSLVEVRDRRPVYRVLFAWPAFHVRVHDALRARASLLVEALERSGIPVEGSASGTAAGFLAGASLGVLVAWAADDDTDAHHRALEVIQQMPPWWPSSTTASSSDDRR